MDKPYLTESKIIGFLIDYMPGEYQSNKTVKSIPECKGRPDYVNFDLKLIVEFDGNSHYQKPDMILKDQEKDRIFAEHGFKMVRIPYFVQLSESVIFNEFGLDIEWEQTYPHGFIDPTAYLPASFCPLGIERFEKDLDQFSYIKDDIISSMEEKVRILGDRRLVYY